MAVELPPEILNQYLMSRSVMQEPQSIVQRVLDSVFGRNILEQATSGLTGAAGSFVPFKGFTAMQFPGQIAKTAFEGSHGADMLRTFMGSQLGQAVNERGVGNRWSPEAFNILAKAMMDSLKFGFPSGLKRVGPMDTSIRSGVEVGKLLPASPEMTHDLINRLLSNYFPRRGS